MAESWSPEDEEGFGIRGPDEDALTEEQQRALNDLKVQTARESHEYLQRHPEVRAMLALLLRETLLQERDIRSVAGDLFRSEKLVVGGVRRMLGMAPKQLISNKSPTARKEEDDFPPPPAPAAAGRQVAFAETHPPRLRWWDVPSFSEGSDAQAHRNSHYADYMTEAPRIRRRDTPAPWTQPEMELVSHVLEEVITQMLDSRTSVTSTKEKETKNEVGSSEDLPRQRLNTSWMLRDLEALAQAVTERSPTGLIGQPASVPVALQGKTGLQKTSAIAGDKTQDGDEKSEEPYIPVARRDTPAPWLGEEDHKLERNERQTYVRRMLERIIAEPGTKETGFKTLGTVVEEGD